LLPGVDAPAVVTNEPEVMQEATQALLTAGHRRIMAVLGPATASTTQRREEGYRKAMAVAGCEPMAYYTDQTASGARQAVKDALSACGDITAVVAFNGPVTEGILAGMRDMNLRCPEDLSLVGFTDAPWMEFFQPPITVVRQPVEAMGALAAKLILNLIDGQSVENKPHVVPSRLLLRSSIVPPS
jgi:DNA-binding LacI/PurR family transcriptional regulator